MSAVDKLYDNEDNVVLRLDAYTKEELISFKEQIDMQLEERDETDN